MTHGGRIASASQRRAGRTWPSSSAGTCWPSTKQLGDPVAAAAYAHLADRDVDAFTAAHPRLAEQILAFSDGHDQPSDADRAEQRRAALRVEHEGRSSSR